MSELTKLKTAQLKTRCKELGITGYSKLSKAQLIESIASKDATHSAERHVKTARVTHDRITHISVNRSHPENPLQVGVRSKPPIDPPTVLLQCTKSTTASPQSAAENALTAPATVKRRGFVALTTVSTGPPKTGQSPLVDGPVGLPAEVIKAHWANHLFLKVQQQSGRLTNGFQGLDRALYASADIFGVALRCWCHRLYVALETGDEVDPTMLPRIKRCQPVGSGVWLVESDKLYLVVGETGEPIGRGKDEIFGVKVRSDWARLLRAGGKWVIQTKAGDFPGGIGRWFQGDRIIAERVVLASCVPESFGGPKVSAAAMDAEWLGRPSKSQMSDRVDLYLPESMQVTSIHTAGLHPGLAVVQRQAGHAEFVLRETGQVVGGEDVAILWQDILCCNNKGE